MTKIVFILAISWSFLAGVPCVAQEDGLTLNLTATGDIVIRHTLEQGQTLYGISKTYGVDINDLISENPERQVDSLKIGQDIRVPIRKNQICYQMEDCEKEKLIPVYYEVHPKDNLFRVARVYFNSSVEDIKSLNAIKGNTLSYGQVLKIGWLPYTDYLQSYLSTDQIKVISQAAPMEAEIVEDTTEILTSLPPSDLPEPSLTSMKDNRSEEVDIVLDGMGRKSEENKIHYFRSEDESEAGEREFNPMHKKLVSRGATAYWNKNSSSKKGFYLLHKDLPVNTLIQISNPVTGESVLARVVGQIPDNIYAPEISVVVTTEVAQALGVIDQKFYVKIAYPED